MLGLLYRLGLLKKFFMATIDDVATAGSVYIPAPMSGTIKGIRTCLGAAITVSEATISVTTETGAITDVVTIASTDSGPGDIDYAVVANHANAAVKKGEFIQITTDGGPTAGGAVVVMIEFEPTVFGG